MTILFAYDGSDSAAAAIAATGKLFEHDRPRAVVLTVWEPLAVEALRAGRFSGWTPVPLDVGQVDEEAEKQAQELAEHGAGLAGEAGFAASARWVADRRRIADTIIESADELAPDLIVLGARGLTGVSAFFGSVSTHVLQHASRPVLVVPHPKTATTAPPEKESAAAS
jgi:nucleotide-binding universal stress UspA family protein